MFVFLSLAGGASAKAAPLTYTKDIAPLVNDRCAMCHHPNGSAPFSLLTYPDVKRRATQIADVTKTRFMPPWKADPDNGPFIGQHPLTDAEIAMIQQWVDAGTVEGDARDLPAALRQAQGKRAWTEAWQLGAPDLVVSLPQPDYARRMIGWSASESCGAGFPIGMIDMAPGPSPALSGQKDAGRRRVTVGFGCFDICR